MADGVSERSGWVWLPRLLAFVGAFLALPFLLVKLLAVTGVPIPEAVESGDILTGWVVLVLAIAALLASWFGQVRLSRLPFPDLGLPSGTPAVRGVTLGLGLGAAIIGAVILAFVAFGWLRWVPDAEAGSAVLAAARLLGILFVAAFVEELLFRGYPFQILERRFGTVAALAFSSVAFAAAHLANPNATTLSLVNIGLAGALLGVAYVRTRSLWFATGVHTGWNWVMGVSELSVSGLDFGMPGFDPALSGPDLATGGAFGPEGGLLVTLVTVAATVRMWRWRLEDESLSPPRSPEDRSGSRDRKDERG